MTKIKMHISKVKLPFYPPCDVKYGLQNRVSTVIKPKTDCFFLFYEFQRFLFSKFHEFQPIFLLHARYY